MNYREQSQEFNTQRILELEEELSKMKEKKNKPGWRFRNYHLLWILAAMIIVEPFFFVWLNINASGAYSFTASVIGGVLSAMYMFWMIFHLDSRRVKLKAQFIDSFNSGED